MVTCETCGNTGYPQYADSTVRCRGCGGRVRPATPEEVRGRETAAVAGQP